MRHIWICIIDGCLIRSGLIQPGDTMPQLMERIARIFPHMRPDSIKVICEDGRIFDSELWFSSPTQAHPENLASDDLLAAVGVVNGHVGIKIHRGKTVEEVLLAEASTFTEKITDDMDFGIYDFLGEKLGSIEDIIAIVGSPEGSEKEPTKEIKQKIRRPRGGRAPSRRFQRRPPRVSARHKPSDPSDPPAGQSNENPPPAQTG